MASFAYSAINAQGVELSGEINATDLPTAREQLRVKGLLAQSIKEIDTSAGVGVQLRIGVRRRRSSAITSSSLRAGAPGRHTKCWASLRC